MFFVFLILSLSTLLVKSPSTFDMIAMRTDCYQSFSYPLIYMEISHYFPTGPFYLYAQYIYYRYSSLPDIGPKIGVSQYSFKKIDKKCKSSVNFTTLGNDFEKLNVQIYLYFDIKKYNIAIIEYTFINGFKPGPYGLQDYDQHFTVHVNINDEIKNYLEIPVDLDKEASIYLKSFTKQDGELCVITNNNPVLVLEPDYGLTAPSGLIVALEALIYLNGKEIGSRIYPAYSCDIGKIYYEKPIIFFIDGKNYNIIFRVIYKTYTLGFSGINFKVFELSNPKFLYVHDLQYVHDTYKKVFLMRINMEIKKCEDGSEPILYLSESRIKYYAILKLRIKILPFVEYIERFSRSLDDPC